MAHLQGPEKSPAYKYMKVVDLKKISYESGLNYQLEVLEAVSRGGEETLIFCSHDPVLTLGRATRSEDIVEWTGETVEVQRGGRVTFHGPGQVIVYPILRLNTRGRDLHKYLRQLEEAVLRLLSDYGVEGRREKGATGVWVGSKKVASIGIAAKKWVTYHGLALNFENEFARYGTFSPCGFKQSDMIGLKELIAEDVSRDQVQQRLKELLIEVLSAEKSAGNPTELTQQASL